MKRFALLLAATRDPDPRGWLRGYRRRGRADHPDPRGTTTTPTPAPTEKASSKVSERRRRRPPEPPIPTARRTIVEAESFPPSSGRPGSGCRPSRRRSRSGACRTGSGPRRAAGLSDLVQAMPGRAQIVAARLLGDRGGQEHDRLEAMAQPFGQAGHLLGVAPAGCGDRARDTAPGRVRPPPSRAAGRRRRPAAIPERASFSRRSRAAKSSGAAATSAASSRRSRSTSPHADASQAESAVDLRAASTDAGRAGASGRPARRRVVASSSPSPAAPARRRDRRAGARGRRRSTAPPRRTSRPGSPGSPVPARSGRRRGPAGRPGRDRPGPTRPPADSSAAPCAAAPG